MLITYLHMPGRFNQQRNPKETSLKAFFCLFIPLMESHVGKAGLKASMQPRMTFYLPSIGTTDMDYHMPS